MRFIVFFAIGFLILNLFLSSGASDKVIEKRMHKISQYYEHCFIALLENKFLVVEGNDSIALHEEVVKLRKDESNHHRKRCPFR